MNRYPRERIEARLVSLALTSANRIFALSHIGEPLKIRPSPSRFCDGVSGYGVLYAAISFETCVVETLVRDRFSRRIRRELPLVSVLIRAWAHIATKPNQVVKLLDFVDRVAWKSVRRPTPRMLDIWLPARRSGAQCMRNIVMSTDSSTRLGSAATIASRCLIGPWTS